MSDPADPGDHDEAPSERPGFAVLWGLLALVAVAALVGGVLAGGAVFASRATGLAGGGETSQSTTAEETLFLPDPTETGRPEQDITFSDTAQPEPSVTSSPATEEPEEEITLESGQTEVGQMEQIDLTGTYFGGDGAVLRVQQLKAGVWSDFPVTVLVNGSDFSTYIQASALGENQFRVMDTDTGDVSNPVTVTIS